MIKKFAANDIANEMFRLLKAASGASQRVSPLDPGELVKGNGCVYTGISPTSFKLSGEAESVISRESTSPDQWDQYIDAIEKCVMNWVNGVNSDSKPAAQTNSADDSVDDSDEEDNLEDFLMKEPDDEACDGASYVDDEISDMMSHAADDESELMRTDELPTATAKDQHLMHGLGKIEASLRRKGEGFAADLVRTTAMSIKQDIVKAASQKTYVLKNLIKMAGDLDSRGQKKAAGLVKTTIEKINR